MERQDTMPISSNSNAIAVSENEHEISNTVGDEDDCGDEWKPPPRRKMFAFDWKQGFVSPYVPSPVDVVKRIAEYLKLSRDDCVVDLGAGEGVLLLDLVAHSGSKGIGVELDQKLIITATQRAASMGLDNNCRFVCGDIFAYDLREASVVVMFLLPEAIRRLVNAPSIVECFDRGVSFVSVRWPIPAWLDYLDAGLSLDECQQQQFYVYRKAGQSKS
eukprot:TRINITY_DN5142_c0_g1_i3.p2 TRINITY_DN5142_c0_g1~~TRINITY_DN5142_c0_g1_i3.p2  ORF type:complete len:217 (+),score=57.94 TRINITY_DN5142_c0_g1_i3:2302-2952(+)